MHNDKLGILVLAVITSLGSGCASIVTGHEQSISVQTQEKGKKIESASCKLNNDKGTWFVTTPGSTTVRRSYGDLSITCEKTGHDNGMLQVQSSTKAMAYGNVLFGGVIGAGVDVATGAAYDYPALITVEMGENQLIERPEKDQEVKENKEEAPQQ